MPSCSFLVVSCLLGGAWGPLGHISVVFQHASLGLSTWQRQGSQIVHGNTKFVGGVEAYSYVLLSYRLL